MKNLSRAVASMIAQCAQPSNSQSGTGAPLIFCSAAPSVQYKSTMTMPHDGITERVGELFKWLCISGLLKKGRFR